MKNVNFLNLDYKQIFEMAKPGDLIYCDPPYSHSQSILYGAQEFRLEELFNSIQKAKDKGVYVALSIDGNKKSGNYLDFLDFTILRMHMTFTLNHRRPFSLSPQYQICMDKYKYV